MRCVDVNVLVYAHRPEAVGHAESSAWLERARLGREPLGLTGVVLSGFVRIVTHPRIFRDPTPLATALDFVHELRTSPAATQIEPGDGHWPIFDRLCREADARGKLVPDAFIAAVAIEHDAVLVSNDRALGRFPLLRLEAPGRS
jgi:uncharacterized protein